MNNTTYNEPVIETPEEQEAYAEQRRLKLAEQLLEHARAKKQRTLELPLVKEATSKMEWLASTGTGASEAVIAVLRYCFKGDDNHSIKYSDLACMDTENTESALLLIGTVARQNYTLPMEYLGSTGRGLI